MAEPHPPSGHTSSHAATHRWLWLTTIADLDGPGRALAALLSRWAPGDEHAVCSLRRATPGFRDAVPSTTLIADAEGRHPVSTALRLLRFCRVWQPDVIHTQLSRADWLGRVVGQALGIPVVSTVHNLHGRMYAAEFSALLAGLGMALDRWTVPLAERLVAVSTGVRDDLAERHPHARVEIIRNGLDLRRVARGLAREDIRRSWGIPSAALVVGTVSGLKHQKGLSYLIDAARRVCAAVPDGWFVHMGSGPLAADLARHIARAGVSHRMRLLGHVDDPMCWLPGLDLFAMPSLWEGLPISLMEAMAAGLPSVGSRVTGVDELIDESTGVLVPPADPVALADAIIGLLQDRERRRALGRCARARAPGMDACLAAGAYRRLFMELTTTRRPGGPRS